MTHGGYGGFGKGSVTTLARCGIAIGRICCLFAAVIPATLLLGGGGQILAQHPADLPDGSPQAGEDSLEVASGPRDSSAVDSVAYSFEGRAFHYDRSRVVFEKELVDVVRIRDQATIRVFQEEYFWEDTLITEISIIDLDGDGFDEDDWLVRQPSELSGRLATIPDRIGDIMAEWRVPRAREYYIQSTAHVEMGMDAISGMSDRSGELLQCHYCIIRSLLFGLSNVYFADPVRVYFERNPQGLLKTVIWDYDESAFHFTGCRAMSDTIPVYDVIKVTRRDTMLVAERNFFDLIYISNTSAETLYVEPPGFDFPRAREARR